MRRWFTRIAITLGVLLLVATTLGFWTVRQTQYVPEFYSRATERLPIKTREASDRLQKDVLRLRDAAGQNGSWRASFSDAEINAWLVEELPKRFPKLLAKGVQDPRIVIEYDRVLVAARYKDRHWDTIVSFEVNVELTEEANLLALRVHNLRAGALPLPIGNFKKGITKEAAKGDIDVRWDMTADGPIALVTVPREHPKYVASPAIVESLDLRDGRLVLSGQTGPSAISRFDPQGRVHRFVSYRHSPKDSRQTDSDKRSESAP